MTLLRRHNKRNTDTGRCARGRHPIIPGISVLNEARENWKPFYRAVFTATLYEDVRMHFQIKHSAKKIRKALRKQLTTISGKVHKATDAMTDN